MQEKADMQRGEGGNMRAFLDWRTYHVAFIAMLEGTVKNALLYWCPLIIHSLVSHRNGCSRPARSLARTAATFSLHLTLQAVCKASWQCADAGCMPSLSGCHGKVEQRLAPIASVAMQATALLNHPKSILKIEEAM